MVRGVLFDKESKVQKIQKCHVTGLGLTRVLAGFLVSVGVGLEGNEIDDSLVVHHLVTLVFGKGVEIVGFGVSDDLISFDDLDLARFLLRMLDFVEHVLTQDVIIQLRFALAVETEATDFAFNFAVFGFVPIILGSPDTNSSM